MATLTDAATFMVDPAINNPMAAGIAQAAFVVAVEDPTTDQHAARVALAKQAIQNPNQLTYYFLYAASAVPAIVDNWVAGNHDAAVAGFPDVITAEWNLIANLYA